MRQANGPWGAGSFEYDPLDNLRISTVGSRSLNHRYDANNRLSSLEGSLNLGIAYDPNGNVAQRGAQGYGFDIGNRLRSAHGRATYQYDGHGRRHWIARADNTGRLSAYDLSGKLRFTWETNRGHTRYVDLGDRLVAEQYESSSSYVHTDMLGSPVAKTDAARNDTERTRYEPYGSTVAGSTNPTAVGFTGHVNDADTGLVYMQQRHYDPFAGRFLSVDPVVTNAKDGSFFGRYHYANNNPYKFRDPDGRAPACTGSRLCSGGGLALGRSGAVYGSLDTPAANRVIALNIAAAVKTIGEKAQASPVVLAARVLSVLMSEGADSGVKIDDKIKGQLGDRGWTEQDVQDAANGPPAGTTTDNRRPNKTEDGQGRSDSATVYGNRGGYVVVNDRTREIVQVSDRMPGSGWIPDSRIKWNGGN